MRAGVALTLFALAGSVISWRNGQGHRLPIHSIAKEVSTHTPKLNATSSRLSVATFVTRSTAGPEHAARLAQIAARAAVERPTALQELRDGQKQGHWIWWIFPALKDWGGDMNSAMQVEGGADMLSCQEAEEYLRMPQLRKAYLDALALAGSAMGQHQRQAPYNVFDAGFGRQPEGQWIQGPVDSFKVRCSATLFAASAAKLNDKEVLDGCLQVLGHFVGDCVYYSGGEGTAGHAEGTQSSAVRLQGPDEQILQRCGVDWSSVTAAANQ